MIKNAKFAAARKRSLNKVRYPSHLLEAYETKGAAQPWRWRLWAINTQNVGPAGEAYLNRAAMIRNIVTVIGVAVNDPPKKGGFVYELNLLGQVRVHV